jgi:ketoreductase RED2
MTVLAGRVALVTGSSRGIGAAIARRFAAEGAAVLVNSRSSEDDGAAVAAELPEGIYRRADVSRDEEARALVAAALGEWGRLDIVVNCAGGSRLVPWDDIEGVDEALWWHCFEVHTLGVWHTSRAAAPALRESGDGAIVNVSSIGASTTTGSSIPYSVSKAGADQLTKLLARTLAPEVRVNSVAPGFVRTPLTDSFPPEYIANYEKGIPLGHGGVPDDIAAACLALARPGFATGTVFAVDGGVHVK